MQAPRIPSFFKLPNAKNFSFKPRYYDEKKERREQVLTKKIYPLKFKINSQKQSIQQSRRHKTLFIIIILCLLAYKLLIN